jgi:hypothetical protein
VIAARVTIIPPPPENEGDRWLSELLHGAGQPELEPEPEPPGRITGGAMQEPPRRPSADGWFRAALDECTTGQPADWTQYE